MHELHKPLLNRTVLVTCSVKKMPALVAGITEMGGIPIPFPAIEVREIKDKVGLDSALASLQQYSWIIFTSAYGVSFFAKRLHELGILPPFSTMPKICAIGPATAAAARESGFRVELVPEKFIAEGIVDALANYHGGIKALAGCRIMIPRALEAREILPAALLEAGARVDVIPCYHTVRALPESGMLRQITEKVPDLILFASSSSVRSLIDTLGEDEGRRILQQSEVAVIGPVTCNTVASFGKRAEIFPKENTIDSLLEAIRRYYYSRHATVREQQ